MISQEVTARFIQSRPLRPMAGWRAYFPLIKVPRNAYFLSLFGLSDFLLRFFDRPQPTWSFGLDMGSQWVS